MSSDISHRCVGLAIGSRGPMTLHRVAVHVGALSLSWTVCVPFPSNFPGHTHDCQEDVELYPVLILKGLGWLLMARFTPHSRADVAQNLVQAASQSHAFILAYSRIPTVASSASGHC